MGFIERWKTLQKKECYGSKQIIYSPGKYIELKSDSVTIYYRWKKRYFILTAEYFSAFNKSVEYYAGFDYNLRIFEVR